MIRPRRNTINIGAALLGLMEWCTTFLLWLAVLFKSRLGSDAAAVEAMIALNIFARMSNDRDKKEWIYELKNALVRSLYERGHCINGSKVIQRLRCWGTWNYDCDQLCQKCGGTGIYREIVLYRFTFDVGGRRITWHQPQDLVTWPVEKARPLFGEYKDRRERPALKFNFNINCFTVWWNLKRYKAAPPLPLFNPLRFRKHQTEGFYGNPGDAYGLLTWLRWRDDWWELSWPAVKYWRMPALRNAYWKPDWFCISWHNGDWTVILFGVSIRKFIYQIKRRIAWTHLK